MLATRFNRSLPEKALFRQGLERLNGRNFTPKQLHERIDLESFLGRHCNILVVHNPIEYRLYANIDIFMPYNECGCEVVNNAKNSSGEMKRLDIRPKYADAVSR